jgi:hypothetical protein
VSNNLSISESAMTKRNDPSSLQDMAHRKVCKMLRESGVKWALRIHSAAVMGRESWLREIKSVEEECVLVRHKITSLPMPLVRDGIALYAVQEFAKLIAAYNNANGRPLLTRIFDREIYEEVYGNMLKAVLLPCISECDIGIADSDFVQELLIKLLYVIPNITSLNLPPVQRPSYMQLLVERIQILTHLQEFHFHTGCTTEIIVELSKYCPQMKKLSVQDSRRVDNKCVEHLLKLRHLLSLNVAETSVSTNSYTALLSGLPQIQEVTWFRPIDPVLRNLTVCLPSVTVFVGTISDAELLVQKCPNITKLLLYFPTQDFSDVGKLRNVTSVSIRKCSYTVIRFNDVIRQFCSTLTILNMHQVENIHMDDIINYCTGLHSLWINFCHITYTEIFHPELPHFQNLKKLSLRRNWGPFDFCSVLHLYVNLNVLHVVGMGQITDTVIGHIVTAGGFRNVTEFEFIRCGYLSMDTACLLMQNCPNLTKLGDINTWPIVANEEVVTFLNFMRNNNISPTISR